ncbi:wax ester/triacylglycerol synthase family O-acyltransferase [Nocardioides sp.]|uniref:WS/DGAT/MGAT family O-acyltransferase n=1 Tax=Nocardioides sp. TaxID=35761 RepID=UPI002630B425|nr:wax ester/triacylglycerol synthase family O-acyltransferase [Nocardioides sp.]MDI6911926.1 wax ester/triacylglycerol synthase family O-acyltransferase [Nocardioides sp.]
MTERLRPRDVAVLAEESASTPMHNATVEIFEPGQSGFDYARLVGLVQERISFVPRYRQRVQPVPGRIANPVWVDDEHFDLGYHVRRSALPRPGTLDQLRDLVARIVSRPLDRSRPLWEMYFVEGLADGQVAILTKSHQVLVDGIETVDLGQVLLDKSPVPKELGADGWRARTRPSSLALMAGAVHDSLTGPETVADTLLSTTGSVLRGAASTARSAGRVLDALANRSASGDSPIIGPLSQQRRVVAVRTDLADYRKVREAHGGTVNDVVLATVTGALRAWLMTRGESMRGVRQIRAVVPVSVIDEELEATSLGSQIAAHFVDLPVREASPVVRLHQVSYSFQAHKETGRAVAATRLIGIPGFAPATFHAVGSRVAAVERRRGYQLSVTNVPGPQAPLYAAGARMVATYPVPPLLEGHPLAIGVTSYDGHVYYGLTADRDMLPDADLLGPCLHEALDELVDSASGSRTRVPRGRKKRRPPEETP